MVPASTGNDSAPWYRFLLNESTLCLLLGLALILCGLGSVKIGSFEFRASEKFPAIATLLLVMSGILLLFLSVTLVLHRAHLWPSRLPIIYMLANSVLIIGFGTYIGFRSPPQQAQRAFVSEWHLDDTSFRLSVLMNELADYRRTSNMLLVCRRDNTTIDFDDDPLAEKSRFFQISEGSKDLQIQFTSEFCQRLKPGDGVTCAVCVIPKGVSTEALALLRDVKSSGGKVLGEFGVDYAQPPTPTAK